MEYDDVYSACPLIRGDSTSKAQMEAPSIENIQRRIRSVEGISNHVVDDVDLILEKCGQNYYALMILSELVINLAKTLKGDIETITVDAVVASNLDNTEDYKCVDCVHSFAIFLARFLPPERFGAIINLILATGRRATTEEIENSLRYLYGAEPYHRIANLPPLPSADLIGEYMNNAEINQMTMDTLKSLVDIRPQVIDDFSAMFEKFPHNDIVSQLLNPIIGELAEDLNGNTTKVDAHSIKEFYINKRYDPNLIDVLESIFSTRLSEVVYCDFIKFYKLCCSNSSIDDIELALEYFYGPNRDA